jgi:protein tyrosine/serine phosphatase
MYRDSVFNDPTVERLLVFAFSAICIAALWAIVFHRQLGQGRTSLSALMVLILLEAGYFALLKLFRGW